MLLEKAFATQECTSLQWAYIDLVLYWNEIKRSSFYITECAVFAQNITCILTLVEFLDTSINLTGCCCRI